MMALVHANYSKTKIAESAKEEPLSERDVEIVEYICGFLLKKLKSRPEAQLLIADNEEPKGLIAVKSRGGLLQPKSDLVTVVGDIEKVFRDLPKTTVDRDLFHEKLCAKDINSSFFEMTDISSVDSDSKEKFYVDMCNLFFSVRAHQKCRHMVDQYTRATHTQRKAKALRDSI